MYTIGPVNYGSSNYFTCEVDGANQDPLQSQFWRHIGYNLTAVCPRNRHCSTYSSKRVNKTVYVRVSLCSSCNINSMLGVLQQTTYVRTSYVYVPRVVALSSSRQRYPLSARSSTPYTWRGVPVPSGTAAAAAAAAAAAVTVRLHKPRPPPPPHTKSNHLRTHTKYLVYEYSTRYALDHASDQKYKNKKVPGLFLCCARLKATALKHFFLYIRIHTAVCSALHMCCIFYNNSTHCRMASNNNNDHATLADGKGNNNSDNNNNQICIVI